MFHAEMQSMNLGVSDSLWWVAHFYVMSNCSASREVFLEAEQLDTTQKTAAMWAGPDIGGYLQEASDHRRKVWVKFASEQRVHHASM